MTTVNIAASVFEQVAAAATAAAPAKTAAAKKVSAAPKASAAKKADITKAPIVNTAKVSAKTAPIAIPFGIHDGMRPGAGRLLFAFTHAWLSLSGMASGKAYNKAQAQQVAGRTAIAYHTSNGNMAEKGGMLTLTAKGQSFFGARAVDAKTCEGYVYVLKNGKPHDATNIKANDACKAVTL